MVQEKSTGEKNNVDPKIISEKQGTKLKKRKPLIRDIASILFWAYLIIKLFVFDLDIYLIQKYFPNYSWVIEKKFFIILGILAIIFLIARKKKILQYVLYVLFYPLILVFWKIPFLIFKQNNWILIFAFIDSIISFFWFI